jgi:hypothetical protein
VDDTAVSLVLHLAQESTHLALAHLQLAGCLHLRDELLLCFLQHHQTVSVPLGHG